MNKHKWFLFWAIVVTLAVALTISLGLLRFYIIQLTLHADLPAWLKALLWGWL